MRTIWLVNKTGLFKHLRCCDKLSPCGFIRSVPKRWQTALPCRLISNSLSSGAVSTRQSPTSSLDSFAQLQEQIGELGTSATVQSEHFLRCRKACSLHMCATVLQVPPAAPLVVIISGPSGVGKDAVIKALQSARPNLHFVVTATSRQSPHLHCCGSLLTMSTL